MAGDVGDDQGSSLSEYWIGNKRDGAKMPYREERNSRTEQTAHKIQNNARF